MNECIETEIHYAWLVVSSPENNPSRPEKVVVNTL